MKQYAYLSALGVAALTSCQEQAQTPQKPNIIYILADDLGYADLGCYGQQKIETPNIDKLASQGMRFTNAYSGAPVSAPSRCVTLTGLHTGHSYIRGNDEMRERGEVWSHKAMLENPLLEGQRPLPTGTITFPMLLQKAGYTTAMIGKWGLGYPTSEGTPNKMGFDFFYGYNCQRQAHTYFPPFMYRNDTREYFDNNKLLDPNTKLDKDADPLDAKEYDKFWQGTFSCDPMHSEILTFVEQQKDKPFFLAWTTPLPHVPLQAPERWVKHYRDKFAEEEEPYLGQNSYFPCRYPKATYAAMISYLDEQVGTLVEKLKQLDIYDNTIIIITSDNGPTFNGGSTSPWFDSAKPFKSEFGWGKASLREGGIRVPLIVAWGDKIKPASLSHHITPSWDLMPTACELAGITPTQNDGISYLPTLLSKDNQQTHQYLYWEFPELGGSKALRMGKWKGLIQNIRKEGETKMMLFDLENDPREQNDLADKHPEIVQQIREKMKEAHQPPQIKAFDM